MDRLINYGGLGKPVYPTSNSEYGRGILSSMRKAGQSGATPTYDPSAPNYYYPQAITSSGGGQWQQPMGMPSTQGHVHSPNCAHFSAGANTKYPTANFGGTQIQLPGVGIGTNVQHTADHIEVLHGDAAREYLATQNGGDDGQGQGEQMNYYAADQGNASDSKQGGMTVSFQSAENPAGGGAGEGGTEQHFGPTMSSARGAAAIGQRQNSSGEYVKVSGLPMDRSQRWRQGNISNPHIVSSARNLKGSSSASAFKLCGKCHRCKNMQEPSSSSTRPTSSTSNFRQQGPVTSTASQRFPVPSAFKPQTRATGQERIVGTQRQRQSIGLPIQGENFSVSMPPPTASGRK